MMASSFQNRKTKFPLPRNKDPGGFYLELETPPWRSISRMDAIHLGKLIDRHAAALVLYARQWCSAPEDVVQEAFVKLMGQAKLPEPILPWLFHVVRNGAISAVRAESRRRRRELAVASWSRAWFIADPAQQLDAAALHEALAGLPAEQREVIVAHVWGSLTFEQIGILATCSTSMAYRRYTAGVETLRTRLGELPCPKN
jgi:RNA polymerase sigma factor (sigma-70 family)